MCSPLLIHFPSEIGDFCNIGFDINNLISNLWLIFLTILKLIWKWHNVNEILLYYTCNATIMFYVTIQNASLICIICTFRIPISYSLLIARWSLGEVKMRLQEKLCPFKVTLKGRGWATKLYTRNRFRCRKNLQSMYSYASARLYHVGITYLSSIKFSLMVISCWNLSP